MDAHAYEIRAFRDGDENSLLRAFNRVFGASDAAFRPRTLEEWNWEFRANPAGRRVFLALFEGEVVAQYAALPARVWIDGRESTFAQIIDSLVDPAHRSGLKRPGLFVRTAWPFFDAYGGPEKDLVHYGWPVASAWRIGKTFLDYEIVRTQTLLGREPGPGPAELPGGVEVLERFDHQARWLYDRCAGEWGASAIRDEDFLNWRFVNNPHHDYTILAVKDDEGIVRGHAVYRFGDWVMPGMGIVCDWLVPPDEPEIGALLTEGVLAQARSDGARSVAALFPEWSPWFQRFQDAGWLVRPSEYFMVARNFDRRFDMLWLRDHWWYQLADTDLV